MLRLEGRARTLSRPSPDLRPERTLAHLGNMAHLHSPRACGGAGRDTGDVGGDRADLFVSHAGADRAWAEWVAWQLTDAGYTVELDVWDWAAGRNFVTAMSDALERCDRVVALFSAAYFDRSRYTTEEWSAALLHEEGVEEGRLVPVRVEAVPAAGMPKCCARWCTATCSVSARSRPGRCCWRRWRGRNARTPSRSSRAGVCRGPGQAGRCWSAAARDDAADLEHPGA